MRRRALRCNDSHRRAVFESEVRKFDIRRQRSAALCRDPVDLADFLIPPLDVRRPSARQVARGRHPVSIDYVLFYLVLLRPKHIPHVA